MKSPANYCLYGEGKKKTQNSQQITEEKQNQKFDRNLLQILIRLQ